MTSNENESIPPTLKDIFDGGEVTFRQSGRFILSDSTRTPEQQRELIIRMSEAVNQLEAAIRSTNEDIMAMLASHDPPDLIVNLSVDCHPLATTALEKVYTPDIDPMCLEHVALLALRRPYRRGPMLIDSQLIVKLSGFLKTLTANTIYLNKARLAKRMKENPELDLAFEEVSAQVRENELFVRGQTYAWNYATVMPAVFEPVAQVLKDDLGFSPEEALKIVEAILQCAEDKLRRRKNEANANANALRRHIQYATVGRVAGEHVRSMSCPVDVLDNGNALPYDTNM